MYDKTYTPDKCISPSKVSITRWQRNAFFVNNILTKGKLRKGFFSDKKLSWKKNWDKVEERERDGRRRIFLQPVNHRRHLQRK